MAPPTLAVVIGVSRYFHQGIVPLPAAQVDAVHFARALHHWGVDEAGIFLLLNEEATLERVEAVFDQLQLFEQEYKLLFYFSGHGYREGGSPPSSFLLFHDSSIEEQRCRNALNLDTIIAKIGQLRAEESYIFIDACSLRINALIHPKLQEEIEGQKILKKSLFCLLSSGVEESFESNKEQYGYFTEALLHSLSKIGGFLASPTELLNAICKRLETRGVALPEMYNIANEKISFLAREDGYTKRASFAKIQDAFIQERGKAICFTGEERSGKSFLARFSTSEKLKTFYLSFPDQALDATLFLAGAIKGRFPNLFEEEISSEEVLTRFTELYPFYLFILDQVERQKKEEINRLLKISSTLRAQVLFISNRPLGHKGLITLHEGRYIVQKPSQKKRYFVSMLLLGAMLTFFIAKTGLCSSYSIFHLNAPHPDFIGRGQSLKWLKNICFDRSKDVPIAVLWGEGGVGKSETVTFFANLHRRDFALIFWIDSETEESYSKSYFRLAKELQISFDQKASTSVVVQKVHQHLEHKSALQPWLLIFDNAQNECELPQKGKGAVLITTRNHLPWYSYPCLELLPFSEEEALTLFQKITQKAETPARRALVKELGYYPLVLNLSAHYIADTPGMTDEDYLTLFSQNKIDLMESMPIDHRYPTDLLASWRMVADQLFNEYPDVLHWLHFCSYLCPDGISSSWLHDWLEERKKNERSFAVQLQMHDILRILVHRCLLRYDPASHKLSLHRLKQEVFKQDRYFDSGTQESVLDFLLKYANYIDKRMNLKSFDELREWEPHAAWFLGNFHKGFTSEKIALLQNALGNWKYAKGEYKSAKSYLEESLKTRIALFGEEDARTLASINGLAATLFEMEQFPEAKHFLTRSLEISKRLYGEEHPDVILALHNLGWGLWEMGQFEEAKALFAQSEEIQFLNAPESSHDLSKIDDPCKRALFFRYAGLWIEEVLGDSKKALGYFKESLNIFRNALGEEDPKTAIAYRSVGITLNRLGCSQESLKYMQKGLDIHKKIFGEYHPQTAKSYSNLGISWRNLKQYDLALKCHEKTLEIRRRVLGEEHSETGKSYDNLGVTLGFMDKHELALKNIQQGLDIRRKSLGEEHPETAKNYANLGISYGRLGQHTLALQCMQKALRLKKKSLGEEHLLTAMAYTQVAACLRKMERYEEALDHDLKALKIRVKILGEEYSATLASYKCLAEDLRLLKREEEARFYEKKIEEINHSLEQHIPVLNEF